MKLLQNFLDDLGARESGGNYKAVNKFGYLGKYQMGEMALTDVGYYKKQNQVYNNDWSGSFLGKDGVNSVQDFLNSSVAQENAQKCFMKKQWSYLKTLGCTRYLGQKFNGIEMTSSGLLAGAHLKGAGSVLAYLKSGGKSVGKDGFGTSVETYIKKFAGYDVHEITNG